MKDFEIIEGLFTLYTKEDEGKVFMEIKLEQIEKIYWCSITREAGDGYYFDSASMMGQFPFIFKQVGRKVLFIHKNVYYRADEQSAIHHAIPRGVSDSIMGSSRIRRFPHPERGSILVNPSGFFIQDIGQVSYFFSEHVDKVEYEFDKDTSYFGGLKSCFISRLPNLSYSQPYPMYVAFSTFITTVFQQFRKRTTNLGLQMTGLGIS